MKTNFTALLFLLIPSFIYSQTIQIDTTFNSDGLIYPFNNVDTVYGLQMSGSITLDSDTSLVRVIFGDTTGTEYMIYETYPLICTQDSFSVSDVYDETYRLNQLIPYSIRVEIIDAELDLDEIECIGEYSESLDQIQYAKKRTIDTIKIETLNEMIPNFGMNWTASDNNIAKLYYHEKKFFFGEKYNLFGEEYYYSGVFEYVWVDNYEQPTLDLVESFDWRYRHDATDPNSDYYENNSSETGWLSSVKDQTVDCGSCWAHSSCGTLEAIFNIFYNGHLDYNLSEQDLISCCPICGNCEDGEVTYSLDYIKNTGIVTEYCFPYETSEIHCNFRCNDPDTVARIDTWDTLTVHIDTLMLAIIEDGPLAIVKYVSPGKFHAMVMAGYLIDPYDCSVIWVLKNSYGSDHTQYKGFNLIKLPMNHIVEAYRINTSVYLEDITLDTICADHNDDGYCWWGIGEEKPDDYDCTYEERDCNDNDPYVGPYDDCYNCECNYELLTQQIHINTSTIWAGTNIIENDIIVDSGYSLTITGTALFVKNANLIVKPGAELIINGGYLTSVCPENWSGIEVWGNPDTTQNFPGLQGKVTTTNGAIIEYADVGILVGARDVDGSYNYEMSGGIILAEDCLFQNNTIDVEYLPYRNMHPYDKGTELNNLGIFQICTFDSYYNREHYYYPQAHVLLRDVKGITFEGCTFNCTDVFDEISYNTETIGILSYNGSFHLTEYCESPTYPCTDYDTCKFNNLRYGIKAYSWDPTKLYSVNNVIFSDNYTAMYLSGINGAEILSNEFYVNPNHAYSLNDTVGGIYLEGCTGYHIENNLFLSNYVFDNFQIGTLSIGAYIKDSGRDPNEIYNNTFRKLNYGVVAEGENRSDDGSTGLQIKCNDYDTCGFDISVTPANYNGIAKNQGSDSNDPEDMAGNRFFVPDEIPDGDYDDINNEGDNIVYFYPENTSGSFNVEPIDYTDNVLLQERTVSSDWSIENGCPSNLIQTGGVDSLKSEMSMVQQKIDSIEIILALLIDGGDTDELQTDVEFSTPPESAEIYNDLMNDSPYLSDTVVSTAIDKEDVLPNAMIRDIMVANTNTAKSDELMNKLDQRIDPMPAYMKNQILQGRSLLSVREETEADLTGYKAEKARLFNLIINWYKCDTSDPIASSDSIILLLQNEDELWAIYQLVSEYIARKDSLNAISLLDSIPLIFEMTGAQSAIHQEYDDYNNIHFKLMSGNKNVYQANALEKNAVFSLYNNANSKARIYARNILIALDTIDFQKHYELPDFTKSYFYNDDYFELSETKPNLLRVFPNPARNYVIIEYKQEMEGEALITITSLNGNIIMSQIIYNMQDQLIINTKEWPSGVYIVSMEKKGYLIDSMKITIAK